MKWEAAKTSMLLLLPVLVLGCAVRSPYKEAGDPLEPVNRVVYAFNDALDRAIIKPVAETYQERVPAPVRSGVRNFFSNLKEPVTIVNDLLQGKAADAASDTMRFGFNTIFGVVGLMDVSTDWGLPHHNEDFGQTFGVWGFGEGWYLMLPILGPSNVRDAVGLPLEWKLDPVRRRSGGRTKLGLFAMRIVSKRADLLGATDVLDTALDRYLQVREAYRQKRWYDIHDGEPPEPDFFDEELEQEMNNLDQEKNDQEQKMNNLEQDG